MAVNATLVNYSPAVSLPALHPPHGLWYDPGELPYSITSASSTTRREVGLQLIGPDHSPDGAFANAVGYTSITGDAALGGSYAVLNCSLNSAKKLTVSGDTPV